MSTVQKFCHSCGRIISRAKSNERNFTNQKYCSTTCRAEKPGPLDRALERTFLDAVMQDQGLGKDKRHGVPCSHVQTRVYEDSTAVGMGLAKERERVRRAGRRIVVFPDLDSVLEKCGPGARLECVQNGKVVEGSFAKGEWGVRIAQ